MNRHPANSVFHALKAAIEQPSEFTRKLDFTEQNAMHAADPDKYWRYVDWLFAGNAGMTRRWAERERGELFDRDKQSSGYEDYASNPKQAAT